VPPTFSVAIDTHGRCRRKVCLRIGKSVFTRGQLYVALGRVGCWEGLNVLASYGH